MANRLCVAALPASLTENPAITTNGSCAGNARNRVAQAAPILIRAARATCNQSARATRKPTFTLFSAIGKYARSAGRLVRWLL